MNWFFLFFFLSGYCSLVCEIVWIHVVSGLALTVIVLPWAVCMGATCPLSRVVEPAPLALTLTDDRPVNEDYLVRQLLPGFWRFWLSCLR